MFENVSKYLTAFAVRLSLFSPSLHHQNLLHHLQSLHLMYLLNQLCLNQVRLHQYHHYNLQTHHFYVPVLRQYHSLFGHPSSKAHRQPRLLHNLFLPAHPNRQNFRLHFRRLHNLILLLFSLCCLCFYQAFSFHSRTPRIL